MFCPNCGVEYRAGFTRCSDCNVELVPELPKTQAPEEKGDARAVWDGTDDQACVKMCHELKEAGIGYQVARTADSHWMKLSVVWRYEIKVAEADYENAKAITEALANPPMSGEEDPAGAIDLPDDQVEEESEELRESSYTEEWYPEDATAEICEQKDEGICSMIEACLKENSIHFRGEEVADGVTKFFVRPEDERKAGKIVQEILGGAPE